MVILPLFIAFLTGINIVKFFLPVHAGQNKASEEKLQRLFGYFRFKF